MFLLLLSFLMALVRFQNARGASYHPDLVYKCHSLCLIHPVNLFSILGRVVDRV